MYRFNCSLCTMIISCLLKSEVSKLCSSGEGRTDGKELPVCTCMSGSTHDCRCVVNGSGAKVAP